MVDALFSRVITRCVRVYQAIAPLRVRQFCRFEPTCSNYMLLSVQKHGPYRGVVKGFKRLLRCKRPHGGVDYP
jgi:putative membrane protein insertion efficiency factor